jgi:membrane protein HdeD
LVAGVIQVFAAFREGWSARALLTALLGSLGILVGISLIARPLEGTIALTWLVAVFFIVSGGAKVLLSWPMRGTQFFWLLLGSGALSVILGILILTGMPASAGIVLGTMLAIDLISSGVALIALGVATGRST